MITNSKDKIATITLLFLLTGTYADTKNWNLNNYEHHQIHRERTRSRALFISLYEHENYKGKVYQQTITRECTNIPRPYDNWASSVAFNDHCVTLCDDIDCKGHCSNFYPNEKGVKRLSQIGLNDKVSSVKYCYRF